MIPFRYWLSLASLEPLLGNAACLFCSEGVQKVSKQGRTPILHLASAEVHPCTHFSSSKVHKMGILPCLETFCPPSESFCCFVEQHRPVKASQNPVKYDSSKEGFFQSSADKACHVGYRWVAGKAAAGLKLDPGKP